MSDTVERCGFVQVRWVDGVYCERRRCAAPAGHSNGPLAYGHGPWEAVPEPDRAPTA